MDRRLPTVGNSPAAGPRPLPARPALGWRFWSVFILPAAIVPAIGILDALLPAGLFDRPLRVVGVFLISGVLVLLSALWLLKLWNALRRQVLAHHGLLCPRCRYPLDRLPPAAACCPECGTRHDPPATVRLWREFCRLEPTELPDPPQRAV